MDGEMLLEGTLLVLSALSAIANGVLFTLKLADLVKVKREGVNGPITFMKMDNIRHQAFIMAAAFGMTMLAVSAWNNKAPLLPQTKNLIVGITVIAGMSVCDAIFTYRRRGRLAELVAQYDAGNVRR